MYLLQLGLIGLCIALLPLSYVWVKADDDKFRKLVWITTFLTLDLVMFGGFTRLTDSGSAARTGRAATARRRRSSRTRRSRPPIRRCPRAPSA